ncbi:MAG: hypothetical protein ACOYEV_02555 [Candidatus Nanopelagicales bacterium]
MRRWSALLAAALLVSGCTSQGGDPGVPFNPCGSSCAGELAGAKYRISLPDRWNGTLLLYFHGYRSPFPAPPDDQPPSTAAEPAPGDQQGTSELAKSLLDQGYALAGSGYARNGWAVSDGLVAGEGLLDFFAKTVGKPRRVYAWGDSLGGLITTLFAADHPQQVTAAAPMCGAVAGILPNLDLALDLEVGYRTLLDPDFQATGYSSLAAAEKAYQRVQKVIAAAVGAGGEQAAAVLALTALVDAAPRTQQFDARDAASRLAGAAQSVLIGLGFGIGARYEAEKRFGGQISTTDPGRYPDRFSRLDKQWIDFVGGDNTSARFFSRLKAVPAITADPAAARRAAQDGGDPTGQLAQPTITLHTASDPLVIVQNQSVLRDKVQSQGDEAELLQLFTVPPRRFDSVDGAPYGAGHCNFSTHTRLGLIELLDAWVSSGAKPSPQEISEQLAGTGYDPDFQPPPWPRE